MITGFALMPNVQNIDYIGFQFKAIEHYESRIPKGIDSSRRCDVPKLTPFSCPII